jgi:hypothetical protein
MDATPFIELLFFNENFRLSKLNASNESIYDSFHDKEYKRQLFFKLRNDFRNYEKSPLVTQRFFTRSVNGEGSGEAIYVVTIYL